MSCCAFDCHNATFAHCMYNRRRRRRMLWNEFCTICLLICFHLFHPKRIKWHTWMLSLSLIRSQFNNGFCFGSMYNYVFITRGFLFATIKAPVSVWVNELHARHKWHTHTCPSGTYTAVLPPIPTAAISTHSFTWTKFDLVTHTSRRPECRRTCIQNNL